MHEPQQMYTHRNLWAMYNRGVLILAARDVRGLVTFVRLIIPDLIDIAIACAFRLTQRKLPLMFVNKMTLNQVRK